MLTSISDFRFVLNCTTFCVSYTAFYTECFQVGSMTPHIVCATDCFVLRAPAILQAFAFISLRVPRGRQPVCVFDGLTQNEIKHAARVLSRYRDARRTRILRIRLRLTVRVKKRTSKRRSSNNRGNKIRTCDLTAPSRAL